MERTYSELKEEEYEEADNKAMTDKRDAIEV